MVRDTDISNRIFFGAIILLSSLLLSGQAIAATVFVDSVRVSTSSDDAESAVTGSAYTHASSDLELPRDNSVQQVIGLRFQAVPIPKGAIVTDARIVFEIDSTAKEVIEGYGAPIDLLIAGESMLGSRETFSAGNQPRDRPLTTAMVDWETADYPAVNELLTTANISLILNELVSDPSWPTIGGTDIVLLLDQDPLAGVGPFGSREVESWDGESTAAPLLTFTYRVVPLPPAMILMASGLFGLLLRRR